MVLNSSNHREREPENQVVVLSFEKFGFGGPIGCLFVLETL